MAVLQVKNLPDDLHASLAARARALDITMSEFVTRALRRELARPTFEDWTRAIADRGGSIRPIDVAWAVDAARTEYDPDERSERA